MLRFAESLTGEEPTASVRMPASMAYPPGPGGIVMRLAWNRRLDWIATAKTLALTADRYLSAATYGGVGHGQISLSSELLGEFSTLLDIPAQDLAAVTGIAFPDPTAERLPASRRVGDLIWKVRCLSVRQLSQVTAVADALAPREP